MMSALDSSGYKVFTDPNGVAWCVDPSGQWFPIEDVLLLAAGYIIENPDTEESTEWRRIYQTLLPHHQMNRLRGYE